MFVRLVANYGRKKAYNIGSRMEKIARDKHSSATKEKSLMTLSPVVNVIKLFSFVTDDEA